MGNELTIIPAPDGAPKRRGRPKKEQTAKPKNKMGRPLKEITDKAFTELCELQCTLLEFAAFFKCSEDTIQRFCKREYSATFAEVYRVKRAGGIISVRRKLFQAALKGRGNTMLLLHLSKTLLGQNDNYTPYDPEYEENEPGTGGYVETYGVTFIGGDTEEVKSKYDVTNHQEQSQTQAHPEQ